MIVGDRFSTSKQVTLHFLKTVTAKGTVNSILSDGLKFYYPRHGNLFILLEFSVAAYRFGHSTVQAAYDYNRNFTNKPETTRLMDATFNLLFAFTGRRDLGGLPVPYESRCRDVAMQRLYKSFEITQNHFYTCILYPEITAELLS
ncbi:MAG: hypothetical protein RMZ43_034335 [Nostoc sp. CmiVER01]|uniref:hypothetical protein n=1 Tax=Nostoc sp. CmiVER01 TaxID=3075384 RepID=UPI002AD464A0|nr:hypothetical protein [Nostoc sp. CmiVER01]MDZ8122069.1 hypothetical protein [Nostoc sp. CmiVER01]